MAFGSSRHARKLEKQQYRSYYSDTKKNKFNGKLNHQVVITGETDDGFLIVHPISTSFKNKEKVMQTGKETREQLNNTQEELNNFNWHLANGDPKSLYGVAQNSNEAGYNQLREESKISVTPVKVHHDNLKVTETHKLFSDKVYQEASDLVLKTCTKQTENKYETLAFNPQISDYETVQFEHKPAIHFKTESQKLEQLELKNVNNKPSNDLPDFD